jgi:hypothetical protein
MSCPKDTNLTVRDEFGNLIAPIVKRISACKNRKKMYPSFTPVIDRLSVNSSPIGVYTVVHITGSNFLPPCNGDTYVNFGSYTHLPITFYSSFNISFVVPLDAVAGLYNIRVVNIYNDNFSLPVSQSYPGIPNYSNSISYAIYDPAYNISYFISGTYVISSDASYNTIINFTGNSVFYIYHIHNNISIDYTVVGGGGGGGGVNSGGSPGAGGGGGGGVAIGLFNANVTSYNIIVGLGGLGGTLQTSTPSTDGLNGLPSAISSVVAVNGGIGGKSSNNNGAGGNSGNGGSGGTGNTNPGGNGINGGGGGGGTPFINAKGGNGSISTTSTYYYGTSFGAGGGGGGGDALPGTAGNIYAGNGGQGGDSATPNYGGGGGGSTSGNGVPGTYGDGGRGGSGRVILYFNN